MKKVNQLEYIVKGFSNETRISIIVLLQKKPELSVNEIAKILKKEERNVSQHLIKMMATGIIMKRKSANEVKQKLTEKGERIYNFLTEI